MQQTWLFQAKPDWYDLVTEIPSRHRDGDEWSPKRYPKEMRAGDHAVLWQAGPEAGVYGFGKLASAPRPAGAGWRVRISYDRLLRQPVFKADLKRHPVLRKLDVLKMPRGTDFAVSPEQWRALQVIAKRDTLNVFAHYKQLEDQFTNGLVSLLQLSTHEGAAVLDSFLADLLNIKPKPLIRQLRVLRGFDGTADAELCGDGCCIRFETKVRSHTLRMEQLRDHLRWLRRAPEARKTLVLLTPDDGGGSYIRKVLASDAIRRFSRDRGHDVLHVEWKDVYDFLEGVRTKCSRTTFALLVGQFLSQIRDRIAAEDYAGTVQKVKFGDVSGVYPETTERHAGYLDQMRRGEWTRWNTPQPYKKLDGTGRKLLLYDRTRQAITVEVEIEKVRRTGSDEGFPYRNYFAPRTLVVYPQPIPLARVVGVPGFENFASGRAAAWNITREQYRQLTEP
jgi:hypothetical protein